MSCLPLTQFCVPVTPELLFCVVNLEWFFAVLDPFPYPTLSWAKSKLRNKKAGVREVPLHNWYLRYLCTPTTNLTTFNCKNGLTFPVKKVENGSGSLLFSAPNPEEDPDPRKNIPVPTSLKVSNIQHTAQSHNVCLETKGFFLYIYFLRIRYLIFSYKC
jgi:hypothetical protein